MSQLTIEILQATCEMIKNDYGRVPTKICMSPETYYKLKADPRAYRDWTATHYLGLRFEVRPEAEFHPYKIFYADGEDE
jgi:hypothetical protein